MIDILHIYASTSGSAGTYLHQIVKALEPNFKQNVIVNYYFPYNYGLKIFYKNSEISNPKFFHRSTVFRLVVRYFEMLYALFCCFVQIKRLKPKIVNYSFTTQINIEKIFFKAVKKYTRSKLFLTAHDVIPFETSYSDFVKTVQARTEFLKFADKIIIHNKNSLKDLNQIFRINESKVIMYPFPIMDITDLPLQNAVVDVTEIFEGAKFVFSFVGHLRKEKGIEVLLEAWKIFCQNYPISETCKLLICGNAPSGTNYDLQDKTNKIVFYSRFMSDFEYKTIIQKSHCVILPYTRGTNSGIPSTVLSLGTRLIVSDIEMFQNNEIIDKRLIFNNGNANSLAEKMAESLNINDYDFSSIEDYRKKFIKVINDVYYNELDKLKEKREILGQRQ